MKSSFKPVVAGFSFAHHGVYSSFYRLMAYLAGCELYHLTPPFQQLVPKDHVRRWNQRWLKAGERRLRPVYRRTTPQLVHYIYPENTLYRGLAWRRGRHKVVVTLHQPHAALTTPDAPGWTSRLLDALFNCDGIAVLCESEVEPIRALTGAKEVRCIRHGIDIDFFQRATAPASTPAGPPRLLTIGNWMRDWPTWASAIHLIRAARPDVVVDVIAEPYSHREARAALGGDMPGVCYHTGIGDQQLKAFYQRASMLFLPLQAATANNAVLESMAMQLPVVLSELPSLRDYTGPDAGIYFPMGDAAAASRAVLSLLENPQAGQREGAALRRRAEQALCWPDIARAYMDFYRHVHSA